MAMAESVWHQKKHVKSLYPIFHSQARTITSSSIHLMELNTLPEGNAWSGNSNENSHGLWEDLRRLCKQGRLKEALDVLQIMDHRGLRADSYTYSSLLQGCINMKTLTEGRLVHTHMMENRFKPGVFLQNKLIVMYANCGSLVEARRVLNGMAEGDIVSWTSMISAYARRGFGGEALRLFYQMQRMGVQPNEFTFSSVLPACGNLVSLKEGKEIHEVIIRTGFESDIFVRNAIIDMYAKCAKLDDARKMFDKMSERDLVSWNAMITGYAHHGYVDEALELFEKMPQRNVVSWTAMIAGNAQHGRFNEAVDLFQKMPRKNAVSWNAMISAYARHGYGEDALSLYCEMRRSGVQPDQFTFTSVLQACANLTALERGKEVHEDIKEYGFQSDAFVGNALIDMYSKCGNVENALHVFEKMSERDVVSWNALISGYAQNGWMNEALRLFQNMPEPNSVSWTTMIAGYAQKGCFHEALEFFQRMPEQDVISWNAVIAGYAKNGHIDQALKLFERMPERDVVSWTTMIAGYAQLGCFEEALKLLHTMPEPNVISWNGMLSGYVRNGHFDEAQKLFQQMQLAGVKPNTGTHATVLLSCANIATLQQGKQVHEDIIRSGFKLDIVVGSALVDMYAKCGSLEDAFNTFDRMPRQDVVSWTAMIVGYAMNGFGKEALQLFEQMQESGIKPNRVTFVGLLSACSHAGLVDDGWQYFQRMRQDYHITPAVEHYCCMVDLLGRAGRLDEAQGFINRIPMEPDAAVWASLLNACRMHNKVEQGEHVAEHLLQLDPQNATHYVMLSNIYAAAGRWDDLKRVRQMMKDKGVNKMPGCSWIEVNNEVYAFVVGDKSPP